MDWYIRKSSQRKKNKALRIDLDQKKNKTENDFVKNEKKRLNILITKTDYGIKLTLEVVNQTDAQKVWKKTSEMKNRYKLPKC